MSKYEYKKMYLAIYLCLIAVGAFSMMARWINNINPKLKILPVFSRSLTHRTYGMQYLESQEQPLHIFTL